MGSAVKISSDVLSALSQEEPAEEDLRSQEDTLQQYAHRAQQAAINESEIGNPCLTQLEATEKCLAEAPVLDCYEISQAYVQCLKML